MGEKIEVTTFFFTLPTLLLPLLAEFQSGLDSVYKASFSFSPLSWACPGHMSKLKKYRED
jgi:hypothetical protein